MKRVVLVLVGLVLIGVVIVAAVMGPVFAGLKPLVDGQELPGGAKRINDGYTSAYLLPQGNGEFALIDCGNDVEAKAIKAALEKQGLGFAAIKNIFITHAHPDHTGGCKQFPNATIYVGEGDKALVEGLEPGKGMIPKMAGIQKHLIITNEKLVKEGDVIEAGELKVRVFIVPGHTAGSAAFLANGSLFVGDSLSIETDGDKIRAAPSVFSDDSEQNVREIKRLAKAISAEEVKAIVPAHSGEVLGTTTLAAF
jgi:glyoxylase-like metal-dependent hydrolase (beta-lactamase superfamily II)